MAHDALAAHARDELGIHEKTRARPVQAAVASAGSFALGAAPPALLAALLSVRVVAPVVMCVTLVLLLTGAWRRFSAVLRSHVARCVSRFGARPRWRVRQPWAGWTALSSSRGTGAAKLLGSV